jgi:hypothetical protein
MYTCSLHLSTCQIAIGKRLTSRFTSVLTPLLAADALGVLAFLCYMPKETRVDVIGEVSKLVALVLLAFNVGGAWMLYAITKALTLSSRMPKQPRKPPQRRSKPNKK